MDSENVIVRLRRKSIALVFIFEMTSIFVAGALVSKYAFGDISSAYRPIIIPAFVLQLSFLVLWTNKYVIKTLKCIIIVPLSSIIDGDIIKLEGDIVTMGGNKLANSRSVICEFNDKYLSLLEDRRTIIQLPLFLLAFSYHGRRIEGGVSTIDS